MLHCKTARSFVWLIILASLPGRKPWTSLQNHTAFYCSQVSRRIVDGAFLQHLGECFEENHAFERRPVLRLPYFDKVMYSHLQQGGRPDDLLIPSWWIAFYDPVSKTGILDGMGYNTREAEKPVAPHWTDSCSLCNRKTGQHTKSAQNQQYLFSEALAVSFRA